jgi:hypothetical protein
MKTNLLMNFSMKKRNMKASILCGRLASALKTISSLQCMEHNRDIKVGWKITRVIGQMFMLSGDLSIPVYGYLC